MTRTKKRKTILPRQQQLLRSKLTDLRPDQKEWLRTHLYRGDAALYACLVSPRNEGVEAAAWSWRCLQQAREKQSEVEE